MNDIKLLGRLTKTPELRKDRYGRDYTYFTMAVPRANNRRTNDYIACIAFDSLARSIAINCTKGRKILAVGHLQVSTSLDDDTKRVRYHSTTVVKYAEFFDTLVTEESEAA